MTPNDKIASFDWYKGNLKWLKANTIFLARSGSHAYGNATENSDEDFRGMCIPPREYFFGLKRFEQMEQIEPGGIDATIFDIRKAVELIAKCNPNAIELLFIDESDWIPVRSSSAFLDLYQNRHLFITKRARFTFSGYAYAQFNRIKTHRNYLLNPVKDKPTRKQFGLPESSVLDKEQLGLVNSKIRRVEDDMGGNGITLDKIRDQDETLVQNAVKELNITPSLIGVIIAERRYSNAMRSFKQYEDWKTNRNPKRAEMEAKFGFDCKHASQLVRLCRMSQEILEGKGVLVKRPDAQELLEIKRGSWSFEKIERYMEETEARLVSLYETSTLPKEPNMKKIEELLVDIVDNFLRST